MTDGNSRSTEKQEIKGDSNEAALAKEKIIGTATSEMEYRVELFNRLTHTCFEKCVAKRYKEGDLHIGENSCVDRCVSKYWQEERLSQAAAQADKTVIVYARAGFMFEVNNIIGRVLAYDRRGT